MVGVPVGAPTARSEGTTTPVLHRLPALMLLPALALSACSAEEPPEADSATAPANDRDDGEHGDAADPAPWTEVEIDGDDVVLGDGERRRRVARIVPERHGDVLHASLRPGEHDSTTVLLLTRSEQRYALRYLVADPTGDAELYGFPWRLQVGAELAEVADVPPTPVWSPDGDTVAWLEWDADGTRLRTVGWVDRGPDSNPSDDARTYRVDDVPEGTQLDRWELDGSRPALLGSDGEKEWRIELDLERRAVALPV